MQQLIDREMQQMLSKKAGRFIELTSSELDEVKELIQKEMERYQVTEDIDWDGIDQMTMQFADGYDLIANRRQDVVSALRD